MSEKAMIDSFKKLFDSLDPADIINEAKVCEAYVHTEYLKNISKAAITSADVDSIVKVHESTKFRLSYENMIAMSDSLSELNGFFEGIVEQVSCLSYQGFDPSALAAFLFTLNNKAKGSVADFQRDMMWCCTIMLTRGPAIMGANKSKRMKDEGLALVRALKQKYHIKPKLGSGDRSTYVVTLSRIAASFPTMVIESLIRCKMERPASVERIVARWGVTVPKFLHTNVWFSILPRTRAYLRLFLGVFTYVMEESEVLQSRDQEYKKKPLDLKVEEALVYVNASLESNYFTPANKVTAANRMLCLWYSDCQTAALALTRFEAETAGWEVALGKAFGANSYTRLTSTFLSD
nr:TPA_asm: nucleocapsid [Beidivirus atrichopogon]